MEKEKLQGFATRVTQANRSELVVIIYEAAIASIEEGKKFLLEDKVSEARKEIDRAKGLIEELMCSLEMKYGISHYLRQLYIYAGGELCQGIALRQPEFFDHALNILQKLLPSFQEVAKQDSSAPVMENTQQIYTGLTYGRGSLNETVAMGMDHSRGYEA